MSGRSKRITFDGPARTLIIIDKPFKNDTRFFRTSREIISAAGFIEIEIEIEIEIGIGIAIAIGFFPLGSRTDACLKGYYSDSGLLTSGHRSKDH